jgi:hypothetical protein
MESDYRVVLGCNCGTASGATASQPTPVKTGVEGETGAAQPKPTTT